MDISELYRIFTEQPQVTTDSRDCPKGSIFFALKGESFNGNAFAAKLSNRAVRMPLSTKKSLPLKATTGIFLLTTV